MLTRRYDEIKWADYHTHILPGIDDGSKSAEDSAKMLCELYSHMVRYVALTPHYIRGNESIAQFCRRRDKSYKKLLPLYNEKTMPRLCLGAEVFLSKGITQNDLHPLCLGNSDILLFEFPPEKFQYWMIDEIEQISYVQKLTPMVAHIDRVFRLFTHEQMKQLFEFGDFIFQINNDALLSHGTRKLLRQHIGGDVSAVMGSDTHDLLRRRPNFDRAGRRLRSVFNRQLFDIVTQTSGELTDIVFS